MEFLAVSEVGTLNSLRKMRNVTGRCVLPFTLLFKINGKLLTSNFVMF